MSKDVFKFILTVEELNGMRTPVPCYDNQDLLEEVQSIMEHYKEPVTLHVRKYQ